MWLGRTILLASWTAVGSAALAAPSASAAAGPEVHLQVIYEECQDQLELNATACACVIADAAVELDPLEIEYAAVRIVGNQAEIDRLRQILRLGQRLSILATLSRIIQHCADGAPFRNPL